MKDSCFLEGTLEINTLSWRPNNSWRVSTYTLDILQSWIKYFLRKVFFIIKVSPSVLQRRLYNPRDDFAFCRVLGGNSAIDRANKSKLGLEKQTLVLHCSEVIFIYYMSKLNIWTFGLNYRLELEDLTYCRWIRMLEIPVNASVCPEKYILSLFQWSSAKKNVPIL